MCGIAGLLSASGQPAHRLESLAGAMADSLAHRGPDSRGVWHDPAAGIALGHRRLAIVDLSPLGAQPMQSASGRYQIAYNGEIYNFRTLRQQLEARGHRFRGGSDTEVLLALIEDVGLEAALPRLVGMFAIALWDGQERRLHLVRDAVGKKPLYVGLAGGDLVFASEPKALAAHPGFRAGVDADALGLMLRRQYIPAPYCIWRDAIKLPAGTRMELEPGQLRSRADLLAAIRPWFDRAAQAARGQADPLQGPDDQLLDRLEAVLETAVAERMIADVPLGAFLSGGVDSSLIVALMARHSSRPVETFTASFGEGGYDESGKAAAVARALGTRHRTLTVSPREALDAIPLLPEIADEPFADASILPSFLICRLARQSVTVSLTGDGGDESFGGYGRYLLAERMARRLAPIPCWLRSAGATALEQAPSGLLSLLARQGGAAPQGYRGSLSADRLRKLAPLVRAADDAARYQALLDVGQARALATPPRPWPAAHPPGLSLDAMHAMMLTDQLSYLPDDVLTKMDRASMAVGLEARSPLLDARVMELAWRLPLRLKLRDGGGKWALRQLLARHLPQQLVDQGKEGFSVPVAEWLRGPLKQWGASLLHDPRTAEDGLLDARAVRLLWQQHQSGEANHAAPLWSLVMFRAWQDRWQRAPAPPAERQPQPGLLQPG